MKHKKNTIVYENYTSDIEQKSTELLNEIIETEQELSQAYTELTSAPLTEEIEVEVLQRTDSFKRASVNMLKAYRKTVGMYDELSARWKDLNKGRNRRFIPTAPANSVIDLAEHRRNHFAIGLNPYKLMLICFIGSFAGVIIELIWCLLRNGYLESRSGLVYGPFNLLYGVGALALSASLYKFRNHGSWLSFIGGFFVGSAVEYACSWAQEVVFGSRSWDYSSVPFNINGRICLLYSVFWGFLGVLWIKNLYPWTAKLILRIPNNIGKTITWVATIFLAFNAIVTLIAVFRWSQRIECIEAANQFWEFIDMRFPNERMERVFANMEF